MPAPKDPEFRRRAVELAPLRDKPIAQIARDLGVAESGLRRRMSASLRSGERAFKIGFRLVRELAGDGFPVAVACRVLGGLDLGLLRVGQTPALQP